MRIALLKAADYGKVLKRRVLEDYFYPHFFIVIIDILTEDFIAFTCRLLIFPTRIFYNEIINFFHFFFLFCGEVIGRSPLPVTQCRNPGYIPSRQGWQHREAERNPLNFSCSWVDLLPSPNI